MEGSIIDAGIRSDGQSVNLGDVGPLRLSMPSDVVPDDQPQCGIAALKAADVTCAIPRAGDYRSHVDHDPQGPGSKWGWNYSHGEIRLYFKGIFDRDRKCAPTAKKEFRTQIRRVLTVLREPKLAAR